MKENYIDYEEVIDVVKVPNKDLKEKMFDNYPSSDIPNNTEYTLVYEDIREIARGATSIHTFIISKDLIDTVDPEGPKPDIQITYTQNTGIRVLKNIVWDGEKYICDKGGVDVGMRTHIDGELLIVDDCVITVTLSQSDTLSFNSYTKGYVQIKLLDSSGYVSTSKIYRIEISQVLNPNEFIPSNN